MSKFKEVINRIDLKKLKRKGILIFRIEWILVFSMLVLNFFNIIDIGNYILFFNIVLSIFCIDLLLTDKKIISIGTMILIILGLNGYNMDMIFTFYIINMIYIILSTLFFSEIKFDIFGEYY